MNTHLRLLCLLLQLAMREACKYVDEKLAVKVWWYWFGDFAQFIRLMLVSDFYTFDLQLKPIYYLEPSGDVICLFRLKSLEKIPLLTVPKPACLQNWLPVTVISLPIWYGWYYVLFIFFVCIFRMRMQTVASYEIYSSLYWFSLHVLYSARILITTLHRPVSCGNDYNIILIIWS